MGWVYLGPGYAPVLDIGCLPGDPGRAGGMGSEAGPGRPTYFWIDYYHTGVGGDSLRNLSGVLEAAGNHTGAEMLR